MTGQRRPRWLIPLASIGVIFLLIVTLLAVWIFEPGAYEREIARLRAEGAPLTLADLDALYPLVPEGEVNAADLYVQAVAKLTVPPRDCFADKDVDENSLEQGDPTAVAIAKAYLAENRESLDLLRAATDARHCRFGPGHVLGDGEYFKPYSDLSSASYVYFFAMLVAASEGDSRGVAEAFRVRFVTAARTADGGMLIDCLVGTGLSKMATGELASCLARCALTESDLVRCQEILAVSDIRRLLRETLRGERAWAIATAYSRPDPPAPGLLGNDSVVYRTIGFHGDRSRHLRLFRRLEDVLSYPEHEVISRLNDLDSWVLDLFRSLDLSDIQPHFHVGTARKAFTAEAQVRILIAALAAERHLLAHGRYPESLAQLEPFGLPANLLDPFTGKPPVLVSDATGCRLTSPGPSSEPNDDITVELPYLKGAKKD